MNSLDSLYLSNNLLTTLPAGVFAGLGSLVRLSLDSNQFTALPDGIFAGIGLSGSLKLHANVVDPLPLSISLEYVGDSQFKAVAPAGVPFAVALPVSTDAWGMIDGGASTITIPAGAVESAPLGVTRRAGAAVTSTVPTAAMCSNASAPGARVEKAELSSKVMREKVRAGRGNG